MSFREKAAWMCLLDTVFVWGAYFVYVFHLIVDRLYESTGTLPVFIGAVALSVLVNGFYAMLVRAKTRQEPKDERDLAIEAKSFRYAYHLLLISLAVVIFTPMFWWKDSLVLGLKTELLLLCFCLAEATKFATRVVGYRLGS
ncbi:MAG: hypothetical protein JWQ90_2654 [Hydrocarboniphaga sp.]|uniref:hypothetical protein n=1 Tax=Hydrocarboniphaga sp. TaxID=2033016 RepID=UPI0026071E33|nr:hypothetical protein [Hydrocarboniphaga sp.]MDB5970204.1 hypothetical protein [Hydrocarboniphaga sp.]